MQHHLEQRPHVAEGMRMLILDYLRLGAGSRLLIRWNLDAADLAAQTALSDFVALCGQESVDVNAEAVDEQSTFCFDDMAGYDVVLYVSKTKSIHRKQLLTGLQDYVGRTTVYRLFDFGYELFELCFRMSKDELQNLNTRVLACAKACSKITITSDTGTDLVVRPDSLASWTSNHGDFRAPFPGVFPCGEVSTYSADIEGVLVADGAINMSYPFEFDPRLDGREVVLQISEGRVTDYSCKDVLIDSLCKKLFEIENANRVGEIGLGTNQTISRFVPFRSLINERVAGFHLGIGSPVKKGAYPDWNCRLHTDFILARPTIRFDDEIVFSDGKWTLSSGMTAEADLYVDAI
ncbi:aminopeptidase [Caballeronia fortuita]|nr:aminopeptidase [Caballeronia fortuita]